MDQQILLDLTQLVSRQGTILACLMGIMLAGLIILGFQLYMLMRALQGIAESVNGVATSVALIAKMTTEVLRRLPER